MDSNAVWHILILLLHITARYNDSIFVAYYYMYVYRLISVFTLKA